MQKENAHRPFRQWAHVLNCGSPKFENRHPCIELSQVWLETALYQSIPRVLGEGLSRYSEQRTGLIDAVPAVTSHLGFITCYHNHLISCFNPRTCKRCDFVRMFLTPKSLSCHEVLEVCGAEFHSLVSPCFLHSCVSVNALLIAFPSGQ